MRTILDTIATYDTERGTTTQTRVISLFEFDELDDAARDRVAREYAEERANDPYFGQYFADTYEGEIWECVHALEKSITGADVRWRYSWWYSADFDCEYTYSDCYSPAYMERVSDTGYYASLDICEAWNAHAGRLNALYHQIVGLDNLLYYAADGSARYWALMEWAERVEGQWFAELEKACEDVRATIENLLRAEWEYYTSEEAARTECEDETAQGYEAHQIDGRGRVFYTDCRKWYTADGELYEQANVNHVCVSIVKAS